MILSEEERVKFQKKRVRSLIKMAQGFNAEWSQEEVFIYVSGIHRLASQIFEASKYSIPEIWNNETLDEIGFYSINRKPNR